METGQSKQALLEYEWSPIFIATNDRIKGVSITFILRYRISQYGIID